MSTTAEPEPPVRVLQRQPWPFHRCPACRHEEFEVSCGTGHVVFSCQGCTRAWRFVLGYLQELPAQPDLGNGTGTVLNHGARIPSGRSATMPVAGQG